MIRIAAGILGVGITILAVRMVARRLAHEPHLRPNFRGNKVIATAGVALCPALVVGGALAPFETNGELTGLVMAGSALGMAALGWIDDVYGDREAGGLFGHARALLKGTFTTGMLKAGGGAMIGLAAAWLLGWRDAWAIPAGAVVALASNLANLFDLRPGRVIKLWLPFALWLEMVVAGGGRVVLAALGGAVLVFFREELREWVMLGDTGAGLLGIALGVGAISVVSKPELLVLLAVLLALTLASEVVSFNRVIAVVRPLRWLDGLGRRAG